MTSPVRTRQTTADPRATPTVALPDAMTQELGTPRVPEMVNGMGSTDPYETTRELVWPANLVVYEKMRRSDSQILATLRGIKMPVLGTTWSVPETSRVREEVRATVEAELGLARDDDGRLRSLPGGVSWDNILRHACLMLDFGHMPLERWWEPGTSDVEGLQGRPTYHLRLSPRMPRSIWRIDVAPNGDLTAIWQVVSDVAGRQGTRPIPRSSLVWFANEQEGADWSGKSVLRVAYKNWMIKDGLLRIGALAADRQGMGVPVVTYPVASEAGGDDNAKKAQALEIARAVRVGDDAGVAMPEGWTLAIVGVTGGTVDVLPQVNYHDQSVAKSALAMFMELGHDAGARSLGDTFFDVFLQSEKVLIKYIEQIFTEEVSREIVRVNFGPDEPYPPIVADAPSAELTAVALASLANAGLLGDLADGITDWVRTRFSLPASDPLFTRTGVPDPAAAPPLPEPDRVPAVPAPLEVVGRQPSPVRPVAPAQPVLPPIAAPVRVAMSDQVDEALVTRFETAVATLAALSPAR